MLTENECKAFKPLEKKQRYADASGLYLEVHPKGGKYWYFKYPFKLKQKWLSLGTYPKVSLKAARLARDEARALLAKGIDPAVERKKSKVVLHSRFDVIAREWLAFKQPQWAAKTYQKNRSFVENHLIPKFGDRDIDDIGAKEFLQYIQVLQKKNGETSKRVAEGASNIFKYAIVTHETNNNPAAAIVGLVKYERGGHFHRLSVQELPELLRKMNTNEARLYPQTLAAIRLLMHTLVRTSELILATWSEIDFDKKEWLIPAERMKMRKPHTVPLSTQVIEILRQLRDINPHTLFILASPNKPKQPLSNNAVLHGLYAMGYKGRMTGHGFRALGLTALKEQLGYDHEIADRALAHLPKGSVNQAYDDAVYIEKRHVMMQTWSDFLQGLV